MKLHMTSTGGKETYVVVTAQREDIEAFADELKSGKRSFSAISGITGFEGIEFRVVPDITPFEKKEERKGKFVLPAILAFIAAVIAFCYFAWVGFRSTFQF
jgi:cell division protein FtsB